MSSEFSNNLPPSAKPYYFTYLQGFDWYKAQLISFTGPLSASAPQNSEQTQNAQQNTPRIKIDGQITNVDEKNKTFSILTDKGTLALKIGRVPLPPEGLRIEIDMPRAREGQQISFRPLSRDLQPNVIQQQIIASQKAQETGVMPSGQTPTSTATPVQPQNEGFIPPLKPAPPLIDSEAVKPAPPQNIVLPALPVLQQGAIIALTPLPPQILSQLVPLPVPSTTAQIVEGTAPLTQPTTAPQQPQQNVAPTTGNSAPTPPLTTPDLQGLQAETPKTPATSTPATSQHLSTAPLPQNNAPLANATRAAQPTAIIVEAIAPQGTTLPTTPPSAQNAPATTPKSPQVAEFIGQTTDGKPVLAIQQTVREETPSMTTSQTTPKGEIAPPSTAPVTRYFTADVQTTGLTQGTKITFSAAPQNITTSTTEALPQAATTTAALPPQAAIANIPPFAFPLTGASDTWPALDEITQSLQQTSPQAAQNLLLQSPNINNPAMKMEPAILFFLIAARSGDIASWLGDKATEMLRTSGKSDALNKMLRDFTGLSHSSREAGSQAVTPEWRSAPIPLFAYNEAHKIMLHYKYDDEAQGDDKSERKKSMRFLIDLDLNRMGDVQLDGFAQKDRLDLIVRTQKPLSSTMQQIMRRKYSGAMEYTGFKGELSFHGAQDKFVKLEAVTEQSGFSI